MGKSEIAELVIHASTKVHLHQLSPGALDTEVHSNNKVHQL